MSNPKSTLAARLKQAREQTEPKLTQEDVASRIGVSSWSVSNWENDGVPPADKLADLARLYGVSADWLLGLQQDSPAAAVPAPAGWYCIWMVWHRRSPPAMMVPDVRPALSIGCKPCHAFDAAPWGDILASSHRAEWPSQQSFGQ